MERCHQLGYGYDSSVIDPEVLNAAKFRHHLKVFPEGQFIALDRTSGEVVGLTVSMRVNASLNKHSARSWAAATGDG
jgi:hypothetical protein